ncbi:MAG: arginase family protein [Chloroflexota bacterium]|nr:arginase family protein [Chloroflexota bacterium]
MTNTPHTWPRRPTAPVSQPLVPRLYGGIPTVYGAPLAESIDDLRAADLAFVGIPWSAPSPDSRAGAASAAFAGTQLTPGIFRQNSLKYGGYLPELEVDVFERLKLVDYGDVSVGNDVNVALEEAYRVTCEVIDAGCIPLTIGGNSGVSSYPVLRAIAERHDKVGVLNFDAHGDNGQTTPEERTDRRYPRWAGTWALRILEELPGVSARNYVHVGLRGPRNDPACITRFVDVGVPRENIYTYRELKQARKRDVDELCREAVARALDGVDALWVGIDTDVLTMGVSPDYGDEPLGITTEELLEIMYQAGLQSGRARFGGLSIMALPPNALTLHWILMYAQLYALAGLVHAGSA